MNDYSKAVANGGNAATMLKEMAPKPVKVEEDPTSIADFIEDMSNKADSSNTDSSNVMTESNESADSKEEDNVGADFAASFGLELEQ